jgi:hypothetical protein
MKYLFLLVGSLMALSGCGEGGFPSPKSHFPQDYLLLGNSVHDISIRNMSSTNGLDVPSKVLAATWNDTFLLAAQAPLTNRLNFPGDAYQIPIQGMTNYWIIALREQQIYGPLTLSSFIEEKARLQVPGDLHLIPVSRLRVQ